MFCFSCGDMFGSLSEDRVGDICNACVLLVKRWKKLPHGSKKNWNHVRDCSVVFSGILHLFTAIVRIILYLLYPKVVDARAGPGFKLTKPKKGKNIDGKKKSKLKNLHKFKRQSEFFLKHCVCTLIGKI